MIKIDSNKWSNNKIDFNKLKGSIITSIQNGHMTDKNDYYTGDGIIFETNNISYLLAHRQECSEEVYIEDINGDLSDLIGTPITQAELVTKQKDKGDYESQTWSFYKLGTTKGTVTIRWYGSSNGYYSETVDFLEKNN